MNKKKLNQKWHMHLPVGHDVTSYSNLNFSAHSPFELHLGAETLAASSDLTLDGLIEGMLVLVCLKAI